MHVDVGICTVYGVLFENTSAILVSPFTKENKMGATFQFVEK